MIDGEWYLRRVAEDELRTAVDARLPQRAAALTAIDVLSADRADAVLTQYRRAARLRHRQTQFEQPWAVRRTAPTISPGRTLVLDWGTVAVHHVTTDDNATSLAVSVKVHRGAAPPWTGSGAGPHHGPPVVAVKDARGARHMAHFMGSGGGAEWDGAFTLAPPLPAGTAWITLFGERLDLTRPAASPPVEVHAIDRGRSPDALAAAYLIHLLESLDLHWGADHGGSVGRSAVRTATETLVGCGALAADADVLGDLRAARGLIGRHASRHPHPGHAHHRPASGDPGALIPRWARLAGRMGRSDGPTGTCFVGADIADLDGVRVLVLDLRADATSLLATVELSAVNAQVVAITADDDRGNGYLAAFAESSGGSEGIRGSVSFTGPIDPAATVLEIQISTFRTRATVSVPLRWDAP